MIPKSENRFSDKFMLKQEQAAKGTAMRLGSPRAA
jgi:hypothetical protein